MLTVYSEQLQILRNDYDAIFCITVMLWQTGSQCLDYMHSIKKLESDPDLAVQVQVRL